MGTASEIEDKFLFLGINSGDSFAQEDGSYNNRKHWRILFLAILIILSSIAFCKKLIDLKN